MKALASRGIRTSKAQLAFDALEFAGGNVGEAKRIIAARSVYISVHGRGPRQSLHGYSI